MFGIVNKLRGRTGGQGDAGPQGPAGPEVDQPNAVSLDLSAGKNNLVAQNNFCCRSDEPGYADSAFKTGSGDVWGPNYCSDKEVYGVPK